VNAVTTKAEGEKQEAALKFMDYITSDEAMQIWLDVVGELPAKPSVGMTDSNANDPVFGPFIRGLAYANTTKFANESAQRAELMQMVERVFLQDAELMDSLKAAAVAEQKILDDYYK
jgi:multiple sugar transport system substrate-binding protein